MRNDYSIQEVAQLLGIPRDTLRYYDRIGIVSPAREDNRYRRYSKSDLIDLMNIQVMQFAGFSLDEIKELFSFLKVEPVTPAYGKEAAAFIEAKQAETRRKMDQLEMVSDLLQVAADTLKNFNEASDQRLAEAVRETYRAIRTSEPGIREVQCHEQRKD